MTHHPESPQTDQELSLMLDLGRRAADLVMEIYATDFTVEEKGKDDPVTRADREANVLICEALAKRFPDHGVIGEESELGAGELARMLAQSRVFFVDPVDGTREFAERNGQFCVMVGLAVEGRAAAGVIVVPVEQKVIWGSAAGGAFLSVAGGTPRSLSISSVAEPSEARVVVSRSHASSETDRILDRLGVGGRIPTGSVGVKAARVLEGVADLYVHAGRGAKKWDACAPDAILGAAGGVLVDLDGGPIDYREEDLAIRRGLVATGPALLPRVLEVTRSR